jgi:hypothetical protein
MNHAGFGAECPAFSTVFSRLTKNPELRMQRLKAWCNPSHNVPSTWKLSEVDRTRFTEHFLIDHGSSIKSMNEQRCTSIKIGFLPK